MTARPAAEVVGRPGTTPGAPPDPKIAIAGAQLMVALDVTIVNIALPHVQAALHFSGLGWLG